MKQTPTVVGSPQQVIDKVLGFRDYAGDVQRILFALELGGIPLPIALEQIDILGESVAPVVRKESARLASPAVPAAPTHSARTALAETVGQRATE